MELQLHEYVCSVIEFFSSSCAEPRLTLTSLLGLQLISLSKLPFSFPAGETQSTWELMPSAESLDLIQSIPYIPWMTIKSVRNKEKKI